MPPRYVYWTILIDNKPTAFRAREKEDLLPTLAQLRRTNAEVVLKWFARGRIWDSPEAEQEAQKRPPVTGEKRGQDWRPGGMHKDPRDRFKKKPDRDKPRDRRPIDPSGRSQQASAPRDARANRTPRRAGGTPVESSHRRTPARRSTAGRIQQATGESAARDRPWENKTGKPPYGAPRGDRSQWQKSNRPPSGPPRGDRPWENKTGKPP